MTDELVCKLPLDESITVDYDLEKILTAPEWEQRASFLSAVLGDRRYDVTIDLGAELERFRPGLRAARGT